MFYMSQRFEITLAIPMHSFETTPAIPMQSAENEEKMLPK